jgi:hypothetical protein
MERFWSKVSKSDKCWIWTISKDHAGYGYFSLSGKTVKAHRVAWELTYGDIPDGLCVLHRCDNPSCVNPEHLFLGDTVINNRDRAAKGRNRDQSGERHNNSFLTTADVLSIRAKFASGNYTYAQLSEIYGVHKMHIGGIIRRVYWRNV